jgi:hypothetical protein
MTNIRIRTLAFGVLAFAFTQTGFAAPVNSCTNSGLPVAGVVTIDCNLYYNGSPNTFDLSGLMTQNGSPLSKNDFVSNYTVIINGNPNTLADDATGLFNTSLWEAVIFYPGGDPNGAIYSDRMDVFWPGSFPSASTVQSYNASIFGPGFDSDFFVQATGSETTIGGGTNDVINVFTAPIAAAAPEPDSLALMATGVLGLGIFCWAKRAPRAPICRTRIG